MRTRFVAHFQPSYLSRSSSGRFARAAAEPLPGRGLEVGVSSLARERLRPVRDAITGYLWRGGEFSMKRWAVVLWLTALPIVAFLAQANYEALLDHPERVLVLLAILVLLGALLIAGLRLWKRDGST